MLDSGHPPILMVRRTSQGIELLDIHLLINTIHTRHSSKKTVLRHRSTIYHITNQTSDRKKPATVTITSIQSNKNTPAVQVLTIHLQPDIIISFISKSSVL